MRRLMGLVLGCSLSALGPRLTPASIGPVAPDLPALCHRADLIVVGQATGVREDGATTLVDSGATYPARLMVVDLDVERALKGTASARIVTFTFAVPTVPVVSVGGVGVAGGQFGIFFLRRGPGGYEVVDPYYPFVIAAPGAPETSGTLVDQVIAEVAYVLDSPGAPAGLKRQAVSVLASSRTPVATGALRAAARNQPLNIRLAAIGVLLARNDISFLAEAQRILLSNDPRIDESSRDNVAFAIRDGVKDPRAIPFLVPLLPSRDVYVRRGAASALRNTHDAAAVKPLAEALYDTDREVRYYAVVGLGETTGQNEWTPSIDYFQQNEQRFLNHWREWAKSRK